MKFTTIFFLCSCLVFFSCVKKKTATPEDKPLVSTDLKPGFPADIRSVNGYFYGQLQRYSYAGNFNNYIFSGFSVSNDPARDLISLFDHYNAGPSSFLSGNVDVGPIMFNDYNLTSQNFGNSISYQNSNGSATFTSPPGVEWKTKGNGAFKPLDVAVTRGFPVIINTYTNSPQGYSISVNNGYTVNFGDFVSNYDSLIITIQNYGSTDVKKRLTPGVTSVHFSSSELSGLFPPSSANSICALNICAFNYSNKITENVCNVFELSNKLTVNNISVVP